MTQPKICDGIVYRGTRQKCPRCGVLHERNARLICESLEVFAYNDLTFVGPRDVRGEPTWTVSCLGSGIGITRGRSRLHAFQEMRKKFEQRVLRAEATPPKQRNDKSPTISVSAPFAVGWIVRVGPDFSPTDLWKVVAIQRIVRRVQPVRLVWRTTVANLRTGERQQHWHACPNLRFHAKRLRTPRPDPVSTNATA